MNATAWKHTKDIDGVIYTIQIDGIKGKRNESNLLKELKDWKSFGEGYDPTKKARTLMFKKIFSSDTDWKKWARTFPYILVEIGSVSGKPKPYKLGLEYIKSKERGSKKNVRKNVRKKQRGRKSTK